MGELVDNYMHYNIQVNIDTVKHICAELYFYEMDVDAIQGKYIVDAKSIMGLFSLDLSRSITIRVHIDDMKKDQTHDIEELLRPYIV